MIGMDFRLATASLKTTKLRSVLTMIAIIIGVTSFMLVTTFIDGFQQSISNEIDEFGGNLVAINPCKAIERDEDRNIISYDPIKNFVCPLALSQDDLKDLRSLDGVIAAAPSMILEAQPLRKGEPIENTFIVSTDYAYPIAFNQKVERGSFFSEDVGKSNFAVIGSGLADDLFGTVGGLGTQIEIRGVKYTILGVMEPYTLSLGGGSFDFNRAIFLPIEAGKRINNGVVGFLEIDVQLEADVVADEYAVEAEKLLFENYDGEEAFTVVTQEESLEVFGNILGYVKTISQVLSYVMLFVGATVITLIMLITVKERTREIGIRKSIGATNGNILTQFMIEAIVISWVGSMIGVVIAYIIGLYLASTTDITPVYTISTIAAVIFVASLIGALAGLVPAFTAARKDPVQALRDE